LKSPEAPSRLSTGALILQLAKEGERLQYRLLSGTGPETGWVSLKVSGKDLLAPRGEEAPAAEAGAADGQAPVVGPGAGYRLRLAVNIDEWTPEGEHEGAEFQFLLDLIPEEDERKAVLRFKFWEDKKRALLSRLLIRATCASALNMATFKGISVPRTKGRKPFLASPLPPSTEAPNFNVNASHEGSWVVCASEPHCVVGIDVAELRRLKKNGEPIDFRKSFRDNLTAHEWREVDKAGADLDRQYEVFSRFWAAKESFVKARGDGLGYPLGQAEFHWSPLEGFDEGAAFEGKVVVEGREAPLWRFVQHRMPGATPHWTTVARGPVSDIVDAQASDPEKRSRSFTATLRKPQLSEQPAAWQAALLADSPPCNVVPVGALVPRDEVEAYIRAGGIRWP